MFALLALAGDLGCLAGPTLVGQVSSSVGDDLHTGLLVAIVFPVVLFFAVFLCRYLVKRKNAAEVALSFAQDGEIPPTDD